MPEKKRKQNDANGDQKKPPGRPKVLAPELDTRHQLRCSRRDLEKWTRRSREAGFPNVSAWIRKIVNDAMRVSG